MEYLLNGNTYLVEPEPVGPQGEVQAKVNGALFSPTIISISENCLLIISGDTVQRAFVAASDDKVYVHLDGRVVAFERIIEDRKRFSRESLEFGSKDQISTPMPGKIVKILVKEGDRVKAKQPLVIVESMKMENELKSPANGVVKSIHFSAGDLVGTGQPIILIDPEELP